MAFDLNVSCDSCHNVFRLSPDEIRRSIVRLASGYSEVMFFVCPECKEFSVVSVTDDNWKSMKKDLDKYVSRYRKYLKANAKDLCEKTFKIVDRKKRKLSDYTDSLIREARSKLILKQVNGSYILVNSKEHDPHLGGD